VGQELTDMKSACGIRSRARSLALFDRRTLLNVAMLLRDSEVARQVRRYLLDTEQAVRVIEADALARRTAGDPLTWTWAE
jgi:restriction system protein